MAKRYFLWTVLTIFVGIIVYRIAGSRISKTSPPFQRGDQPLPVKVAKVHRGNIEEKLFLTGNIEAEAQVDVFSNTVGEMEEIFVERGDVVKRGQIIAMIEHKQLKHKVEQVEASLNVLKAEWAKMEAGARPEELTQAKDRVRRTQADYENAKLTFQRMKYLYEQGVISKGELDNTQANYTIALAEYNSAQENLKLVQQGARQEERQALKAKISEAEATLRLERSKLNDAYITSPMDGIVSKRYLDRGAHVSSSSVILNIVQMDKLKVLIDVVEKDLGLIKIGGPAIIWVDAYPSKIFQGRVSKISPVVDPSSRTAEVEISLPNPDLLLKPGMYAKVDLVVGSHENVLLVPKIAFLSGEESNKLFIHRDGKAYLISVDKGLEDANIVEVINPLQEGEEVIIAGQSNLHSQVPIRVVK